jgi:hypothetical protein
MFAAVILMIPEYYPSANNKQHMKKAFLTGILILAFLYSYPRTDFRSGYIINLENDTVFGRVDHRLISRNFRLCRFQSPDGVITEYIPAQISGFGFDDGSFYTSRVLDTLFAEVLISGEMSLYKTGRILYLHKNGYDLHMIDPAVRFEVYEPGKAIKSRWKMIINYWIIDCEAGISTDKLNKSEKDLVKLAKEYNRCKGVDFVEHKSAIPWVRLSPGISLGASRSEVITFKTERGITNLPPTYTSIDPSLGVFLTLSAPRTTKNLSLQTEAHIVHSKYNHFLELNPFQGNEKHESFLQFTILSTPLMIRYSIPFSGYSLIAMGGVNFDHRLKTHTLLVSDYRFFDDESSFERAIYNIKRTEMGVRGGIGLQKSYPKFNGGIMISYQSNLKRDFRVGFPRLDSLIISLTMSRK